MLIRPKTKAAYMKLKACKSQTEREALVARGTAKAAPMLNFDTMETLYRPQVGPYVLMETHADLGYLTSQAAARRAREIKEEWSQ